MFKSLFIQFNVLILLPIIGFGIAYYTFNYISEKLIICNLGWKAHAVISFFGVPIHEISHLLMSLIFRHKIINFSIYRPFKGQTDGIYGYVHYGYKTKSIYQNIGVFFASIAPMLGGTGVILILMKLLLPKTFSSLIFDVTYDNLFSVLISNIKNLLLLKDGVFFFIVFTVFSCMISMHIHISTVDLKNCFRGLFFLEFAIIFLSIMIKLLNVNFDFMKISSILIFLLIIGFIFSLLSMLLSLITLIKKAWD